MLLHQTLYGRPGSIYLSLLSILFTFEVLNFRRFLIGKFSPINTNTTFNVTQLVDATVAALPVQFPLVLVDLRFIVVIK